MSALLDTTAETARWLIEEKKLSINAVARRMDITPGAVRNALRRLERKSPSRRQVVRATASIPDCELPPIIDREPCPLCGVRSDFHAAAGCKRWRPL